MLKIFFRCIKSVFVVLITLLLIDTSASFYQKLEADIVKAKYLTQSPETGYIKLHKDYTFIEANDVKEYTIRYQFMFEGREVHGVSTTLMLPNDFSKTLLYYDKNDISNNHIDPNYQLATLENDALLTQFLLGILLLGSVFLAWILLYRIWANTNEKYSSIKASSYLGN